MIAELPELPIVGHDEIYCLTVSAFSSTLHPFSVIAGFTVLSCVVVITLVF